MTAVDTLHYARPDEVHALERLQRRASGRDSDPAGGAENPDAVRISVAAVRDQRVRVAVGDGVMLGFATVLPVARQVSRLDALYVEPQWAGRGVGAALLEDAEAIAADEGIVRLEVAVTGGLVAYFEAAGFVTDPAATVDCGRLVPMARAL